MMSLRRSELLKTPDHRKGCTMRAYVKTLDDRAISVIQQMSFP